MHLRWVVLFEMRVFRLNNFVNFSSLQSGKRKEKGMKRNVFSELSEGFDALKAEGEGKVTLRTHAVKRKPAAAVTVPPATPAKP